MTSGEPSSNGTAVHEFFLDEELLLFFEQDSSLYRLNTSAAFIWCHQAAGISIPETSRALANTFNIPAEKAQADVLASLTEWYRLGLLDSPPSPTVKNLLPRKENPETEAIVKYRFIPPLPEAHEHRYFIADTFFRVRFPTPGTREAVHPLLAHLEVAATDPFDITFDIIPDSGGYLLLQDSTPITRCQNLAQLGPLIHAELLVTACKSAECLAIIHAAAITNNNHEAFLFPGDSGSGKSTLAAALLAKGYGYLSDEIGLLTPHPYRLLPVPLSIGIKEGAWPVLAPFHPQVDTLPTYHRLDGKKIRYLPPCNVSNQRLEGYPIKRLLFPRYRVDTTTQIRSISRAEALYRIAEGGYDVNCRLTPTTVAELINWITTIECYEIQYSSLSEVLGHIQELLA